MSNQQPKSLQRSLESENQEPKQGTEPGTSGDFAIYWFTKSTFRSNIGLFDCDRHLGRWWGQTHGFNCDRILFCMDILKDGDGPTRPLLEEEKHISFFITVYQTNILPSSDAIVMSGPCLS